MADADTHAEFLKGLFGKIKSGLSSLGSAMAPIAGQALQGMAAGAMGMPPPGMGGMMGGGMIGATPDYSERPWRKDLLYLNVTAAMEKARGSKQCD